MASPVVRLLAASLGLLPLASVAGAEPTSGPRFALIPITRHDERLDALLPLAREVEAVLGGRGDTFVATAAASDLFARDHSREPASWDQSDVDRLAAASRKALEAIVAGDYKGALVHTREARQRVDGAIEVINRRLEWSREAFRACAMEVRGRYEERDQQGAFEAAVRCRTLYPGFEPDAAVHPKDVRQIFGQAETEIRRTRTRTLVVDSRPVGCSVFLNGRALGTTPFRQEGLGAHEPRLQVECAGTTGHGRVHVVPPGSAVYMFVDADFEAAVRTDGDVLRLVYDEHNHARQHEHALLVTRALGTTEALTFSSPSPGQLQISRFTNSAGRTISLPFRYAPWQLDKAISELLEAPDKPTRTTPRVPSGGVARDHLPVTRRTGRTLLAAGGVSLALAVAASVASWTIFRQRMDDGMWFRATVPSDGEYLTRQTAWVEQRPVTYGLAASAAGLGTLGGILVERGLSKRPARWWRWASLSIGSALVASGIGLTATGTRCTAHTAPDRRDCVIEQHRMDRGAFLLLQAAPFLLTPAASRLRDKIRGDVRLNVDAGRSAAMLRLTWSL